MMQPAACSQELRFHPLELIPYFRRFPASRARNLLYTFIFNILIGTAFLLAHAALDGRLPTPRRVWFFLVVSNFIGFAIHALFEGSVVIGVDEWARRRGVVARAVYFIVIPMLGVIAGFQAADWTLNIGFRNWMVTPGWIVSIVTTSVVVSAFLSMVFYLRQHEALAQAELERERGTTERVQREAVAANLRALQAQIEPHFLFNTLANVSSLIDREPGEAKRMLERFNSFLRASLAATRTERTTLGAERELIAAYLDVLHVRMGERLRYAIDIPPDLESFPIAPMLVQPVVENAIRHGLEPKLEGGSVEIRARREGPDVVIEVRDRGAGFAPATDSGVGLANLRDRLRGLYGEGARLTISDNAPAGTVVAIRIPA